MFYGSQTGTAEEFATRLCKEARYYGISAMSADPIEYDIVSVPLWLVSLFLVQDKSIVWSYFTLQRLETYNHFIV